MQKARMFLRLRTFSDNCDPTSLMNTYQTRRQIPDYLCLNQPAGHIPPGTAHVSKFCFFFFFMNNYHHSFFHSGGKPWQEPFLHSCIELSCKIRFHWHQKSDSQHSTLKTSISNIFLKFFLRL
jgi:hypothetical protein